MDNSKKDHCLVEQFPLLSHLGGFLDFARDKSLIFELLELKHDIEDNGSATWFLQDLAREQGVEGNIIISFWEVTQQSTMFEAPEL
uniref:Uncharacterized protein n=1 Tax=Lactuca sativa TaxID=4236 RepID=A0A9R1URN0_LACSA|nr:hypothetical protein LSAT_V11C800449840 [Lactuca sativa]